MLAESPSTAVCEFELIPSGWHLGGQMKIGTGFFQSLLEIPGGPGNPYARRVAAMRTQLLDAVDADGIAEVARAMLVAAKAGDTAAARLVLSYAVGPPLPAADPDRLDANELEALRSRPNMLDRIAFDPLTPEPMSLFREEGD
jgi:hypothetical protein